jgi:formylglycine-generating enzyme required for sulfatase activity
MAPLGGGNMRFFVLVATLLGALAASPALAQKRIALVIGINSYPNLIDKTNTDPEKRNRFQLQKAINDAEEVGRTLSRLGFTVEVVRDPTQETMIRRVTALAERISPGDTVFFFFSGHGLHTDGNNLLVPSDIPDLTQGSAAIRQLVIQRSYSEAAILSTLRNKLTDKTGRQKGLIIYVSDACRNNPFPIAGLDLAKSGPASQQFGVKPVESSGVFSIYSAGAGQIALDRLSNADANPNSVFTRVFLEHLTKQEHLNDILAQVRQRVIQLAATSIDPITNQAIYQNPSFYDQTDGDFIYLSGRPEALDERYWSFLKTTTDVRALRTFVAEYPNSPRRPEAEARITQLEGRIAMNARFPVPCVTDEAALKTSLAGRAHSPLSRVEECALKQQDSFKECPVCPEMVVIPSGNFPMGSPPTEDRRSDDEGPQHRVTIAAPFAVGRFEITVDQFAAFLQEAGHDAGSKCFTNETNKWEEQSGRSWRSPGFAQNGSHPVACINWHDAKAYVDWLSRKTGKIYRLLSEAEWEYTARAGSVTRFHFGDRSDGICKFGNGVDQTAKGSHPSWTVVSLCSDSHVYTAPVGSFTANDFGMHDMHGNVWEWVEDCWNESYRGAPMDGSVWASGNCGQRVLRGGSWTNNPNDLRTAFRNRYSAEDRYNNAGIRVARTLAP